MLHRRRTAGLVGAALAVAATAACTSGTGQPPAAARSSEAAAAATSAANAKPGSYGTPADVSLPNPTHVATDPPTSAAPTGTAVQVSLTYFGWDAPTKEVQVRGFVPGVVESDGTCTLTLTKGELAAHGTRTATPSASSTSCGQLTVPGNEVASGTWTATLSYRSAVHHGTSRSVEVTVP